MSRDRVSVNEDGSFKNVGDGPGEDTDVHTRTDADHEPDRPGFIDHDPERPTGSHGVLPDLRHSVRSREEVDRRRKRELPTWAPYAGVAILFVAIMAIGVWGVMLATQRPETVAPEPPAKADEVGGVPVREDLNAPGL